jgi:hypothetical protein
LPKYECKVGVRGVEQLEKKVLHFYVVVRAAQAKTGRTFHRAARFVVELCDEGPEINVHYAALI